MRGAPSFPRPHSPPDLAAAGLAGGRARRLEAALCQEESLPGHRGSPGGAMRRMSAPSTGGGTSRARISAAAAAALLRPAKRAPGVRPRPATPPPRPRPRSAVAGATGLRAESAVYSQPSARKFGREAARRTSLGWGAGEGGDRVDQAALGAWGKGGVRRSSPGVTDPSEGRLLRKPGLFPGREWIKFSCPRGAEIPLQVSGANPPRTHALLREPVLGASAPSLSSHSLIHSFIHSANLYGTQPAVRDCSRSSKTRPCSPARQRLSGSNQMITSKYVN